MAKHSTAWRSVAQHGTAWHSMAEYGAVWHNIVQCRTENHSIAQHSQSCRRQKNNHYRIQSSDIPRAGWGGAVRTAKRRRWQGRAERDVDGSVRPGKNRPSDALANQKQCNVVDDFSEARTKEILCEPMEEQSPRLTRPAVYPRFINGTRSALCSWLLASVPTPTYLCL